MTDYIHPNPGYHDYEDGVKNALRHSHFLTSQNYGEDPRVDMSTVSELAAIKSYTKEAWSRPDTRETTYQFQYQPKNLLERTKSAPTETLRKNNPHPKEVFLTSRLHYVPGYHNADSTLNKPHYQTDDAVESDELSYRQRIRAKYSPKVSSRAVNQYAPQCQDSDDIVRWNRTLPPNDSWMASSAFHAKPSSNQFATSMDEAIGDAERANEFDTASHTRFLRLAGADEKRRIQRALDPKTNMDKIPNLMVPYQIKGNLGSQKQQDRANVQAHPHKPLYRFPRPRGDFLIHPVWPPSMWHHRIPGFKPDPPARGVMSAYERHQATRLTGVY